MQNKYDDIIDLPHHQSDKRPHMSIHDRAAQFSPFAALTGHEAAITEAGRLTESFREPDEGVKAMLDGKLQLLQENRQSGPEVEVIHFVPDQRKSGGSYVTTGGVFVKVDPQEKLLCLAGGEKIALDLIQDLHSPVFGDEIWGL